MQTEKNTAPKRKLDLRSWFKPDPYPADLDRREVSREVWKITLPSMAELILTSLTGMVDTMMVSQLGSWATASVGLSTQPKFILMACFIALNSGATAMVARFKGANDHKTAQQTMHQCLLITIILSLLLAVVGYTCAEPLVRFMGAVEGETLVPAMQYLQIQMLGFMSMSVTTAITAVLRGVGKTRAPMIYNIIANVVNVAMNYCLIYGKFGFPEMGVAGASLATVIGQIVAMIIALVVISSGKFYLKLHVKELFQVHFDIIGRILKIGTPAMIEQLIMRTGMLLFTKIVTNLGTDAYATHQVCMNIMSMSFMNGQAFGIAGTTFVGQSLGKKRVDVAKAYVRTIRNYGMMVSTFLGLVMFFFGKQIVGLYLNDPAIMDTGANLLRIVALLQPLQGSQFILSGCLRGAGDTKSTAYITLVGVLLVRPVFGYLFVYPLSFGIYGAWVALALDQFTRSVFSLYRYKLGKWETIKV